MINGSVIGCQVELKIAEGEPRVVEPRDLRKDPRLIHTALGHQNVEVQVKHLSITLGERFGFIFHRKYGIKIIDCSGNI